MKTVFISIYDGDTEKNALRSGVLERLLQSDCRIVLLIRGESRLEYYLENYKDPRIVIELLPRAENWSEHIWYYISWNTVPTRSVRLRRLMRYARNKKHMQYWVGTILWLLGHVRPWRELLRLAYRMQRDDYIAGLFDTYAPSVVFAPNMFSPEDSRTLRAATKRRIPTITTAKSWDVLTTKAFTRVKADAIVAFNEIIAKEAVRYGDYSPSRVVVTGFPQFDVYADEKTFSTRDEFFARLGIGSEQRLILFGVPGSWQAEYTHEILSELDRRIEAGRFSKPVTVLARLHPKYPDTVESMSYKHILLDRPGTHFGTKEFSVDLGVHGAYAWTFTDKDITHLANSLRHSDMVVNLVSTLTLDAAANDRPAILICYEGDTKLPYALSARIWYDFLHYRNIVRANACPLVHDHDELERAINAFLKDPNYLRAERTELQRSFLHKRDGRAAERITSAIVSMIQ